MQPVPAKEFKTPTPIEVEENSEYWRGYDAGQPACENLPSPAGIATWDLYCDQWQVDKLDAEESGYPINYTVGYNDALLLGANYYWRTTPGSGFNTVIET